MHHFLKLLRQATSILVVSDSLFTAKTVAAWRARTPQTQRCQQHTHLGARVCRARRTPLHYAHRGDGNPFADLQSRTPGRPRTDSPRRDAGGEQLHAPPARRLQRCHLPRLRSRWRPSVIDGGARAPVQPRAGASKRNTGGERPLAPPAQGLQGRDILRLRGQRRPSGGIGFTPSPRSVAFGAAGANRVSFADATSSSTSIAFGRAPARPPSRPVSTTPAPSIAIG